MGTTEAPASDLEPNLGDNTDVDSYSLTVGYVPVPNGNTIRPSLA